MNQRLAQNRKNTWSGIKIANFTLFIANSPQKLWKHPFWAPAHKRGTGGRL
jgi:hypothetical protein